jgi:hypothetical protein
VIEFKISALKALAATSGGHIDTAEAIQHVAANMLLCSVEVGTVTYSPCFTVLIIVFYTRHTEYPAVPASGRVTFAPPRT